MPKKFLRPLSPTEGVNKKHFSNKNNLNFTWWPKLLWQSLCWQRLSRKKHAWPCEKMKRLIILSHDPPYSHYYYNTVVTISIACNSCAMINFFLGGKVRIFLCRKFIVLHRYSIRKIFHIKRSEKQKRVLWYSLDTYSLCTLMYFLKYSLEYFRHILQLKLAEQKQW